MIPYTSNKGMKKIIAYTIDGAWENRAGLPNKSKGPKVEDQLRVFIVVREEVGA